MDLQRARAYYIGLIDSLDNIVKYDGSPWIYSCAATLIDQLAKLADGSDQKAAGYKNFVRDYLSRVDPRYLTFTYASGDTDLPEQMYHILRCGIVHAFSLVADPQSAAKGGRDRSIVLTHRYSAGNKSHLSSYSGPMATDSCLLIAEDFLNDLRKVIELLFDEACNNQAIETNILTWMTHQPPIAAGV